MTLSFGLSGDIKEVADKFFEYCGRNGDNSIMYTIEVDLPEEQVYHVHTMRSNKIGELYEKMGEFIEDKRINMFKENKKEGVIAFKFSVDPIEELTDFHLSKFGIVSDNTAKVHLMSVADLWESHSNHSCYKQLDDDTIADLMISLHENRLIKPIILDDEIFTAQYPHGIIQDGYKRLYAYKMLGLETIEVVKTSDILMEDQYKFATAKHARSQAPRSGSSLEPSKTFGGETTVKSGKKKKRQSIFQKIDESIASIIPPDILGIFVQGLDGVSHVPQAHHQEVISIEIEAPPMIASKLQDVLGCHNDIGANSIELADILNKLRAIDIVMGVQSHLNKAIGFPSCECDHMKYGDMLGELVFGLGEEPCCDLSEIGNKAGIAACFSSNPGEVMQKYQDLAKHRLEEYNKALNRVKSIDLTTAGVLQRIISSSSCGLHTLE